MKMTNNEIYTHAVQLKEAFEDMNQRLPVKVNFYLQKNKAVLLELGQAIEEARMEIIRDYGELTESGDSYSIPGDKIEAAQKELEDLLALEQEVNIYMINIDSFSDDISFTTGQMEAIMFMVE